MTFIHTKTPPDIGFESVWTYLQNNDPKLNYDKREYPEYLAETKVLGKFLGWWKNNECVFITQKFVVFDYNNNGIWKGKFLLNSTYLMKCIDVRLEDNPAVTYKVYGITDVKEISGFG